MIDLTLRTVAAATGGQLVKNGADVTVQGISTDTRTLQPGDLYVPLRGPRFDGHDFLAQAAQAGAAACLSEDTVGGLSIPVIQVEDTLRALGDLAGVVRNRFRGPVVGITGTSGKTTTKEMLAAILERTGAGLKSAGNFNNLVGVPLTLFGLKPDHGWAVLELGMSERGEIERLTQIARPGIGVITNVGSAHLESLGGIDGVARAKGELFANLPIGGIALVNADDPHVVCLPVANGVRTISFGFSSEAEVRAEQVAVESGVVTFELRVKTDVDRVRLPLPGRHNVMNALAAAAAAYALNVSFADIVAGLEEFNPCPGRMELIELTRGVLLLNDSYNANPLSVRAALDALNDLDSPGRRVALLGDMLELGEAAVDLHHEMGRMAAERVDHLYLYGGYAKALRQGALDAGLDADRIEIGADHADLADRILRKLQPGDRLLVKGSRGMQLEQVVDQLMAADKKPGTH